MVASQITESYLDQMDKAVCNLLPPLLLFGPLKRLRISKRKELAWLLWASGLILTACAVSPMAGFKTMFFAAFSIAPSQRVAMSRIWKKTRQALDSISCWLPVISITSWQWMELHHQSVMCQAGQFHSCLRKCPIPTWTVEQK